MNKVTVDCYKKYFEECVLKFNMSKKTAADLYEYSIAVWRCTKLGSGLTFPEIEQTIKNFTP